MNRRSPLLFLRLPKGTSRFLNIYTPDQFNRYGLMVAKDVWQGVDPEWRDLPTVSKLGFIGVKTKFRTEVQPMGISMERFALKYQACEARNLPGDAMLSEVDLTIAFHVYEYFFPPYIAQEMGRQGGWAVGLQQVIAHFDEESCSDYPPFAEETWADELYNSARRDA